MTKQDKIEVSRRGFLVGSLAAGTVTMGYALMGGPTGIAEARAAGTFAPNIWFDMDSDGDQDLLIVGFAENLTLYRNDLNHVGHWLRVRIRRDGPNPFGVGSVVWVKRTADDPPRRREIDANQTYGSQGPIEAHFGLGEHADTLFEVRVVFPDGDEVVLNDVPIDQGLVITGKE